MTTTYYAIAQKYMQEPRLKFFYSKAARDKWCNQKSITPRRPVDGKEAREIMTDKIKERGLDDEVRKRFGSLNHGSFLREISYWSMEDIKWVYRYYYEL